MAKLGKKMKLLLLTCLLGMCLFMVGNVNVCAKPLRILQKKQVKTVTNTIDCTRFNKDCSDKSGAWTWNNDTKTLQLQNCTISVQDGYAIVLPEGASIISKGKCIINAKNGIKADGDLYIEGVFDIKSVDKGLDLYGDLLSKDVLSQAIMSIYSENVGINFNNDTESVLSGNVNITYAEYAIHSDKNVNFKVNGGLAVDGCMYGAYANELVIGANEVYMYIEKYALYAEKEATLCANVFFEINSEKNGIYGNNSVGLDGVGILDTSENAIESKGDVVIQTPALDSSTISINSNNCGISSDKKVELRCCNLEINSKNVAIETEGEVNFTNSLEGFYVNNYHVAGDDCAIIAGKIEFEDELMIENDLCVVKLNDGKETISEDLNCNIVDNAANEFVVKEGEGIVVHANDETGRTYSVTKLNDTCTLSKDLFKREGYKIEGWYILGEDNEIETELPVNYPMIYCEDGKLINVYAKWAEADNTTMKIGDNVTASLNEEGLLIIAGEGETYDLTASTSIVSYFKNMDMVIKNVVVKDGVTSLGKYALCNGSDIESVELSSSLETIGVSCFYNCKNLSEIYITKNVINIGAKAFMNCSSLKKIALPEGITDVSTYIFRLSTLFDETTTVYTDNTVFKEYDWSKWKRNTVDFKSYNEY